MAKGAQELGALKAIDEIVPREHIKILSCASIGVLNGYAYVTGALERGEKIWRAVVGSDDGVLFGQVLRSARLQESIENLYDPDSPVTTPFYCAMLDTKNRKLDYLDMAKIPDDQICRLLRASVAIPVYNRAVRVCGVAYYDGALVDIIPVYPLIDKDLDCVICVYFDDVCYKFESAEFDSKVIRVTFPSKSRLGEMFVFRKNSIEEMIEQGYERTSRVLKAVFAGGFDDVAAVRRAIETMNLNAPAPRLRITSEVLTTNLNRITQRLMKRKIIK